MEGGGSGVCGGDAEEDSSQHRKQSPPPVIDAPVPAPAPATNPPLVLVVEQGGAKGGGGEEAQVSPPRVQVIRPWAYQLRDPTSLHLANWSQAGFGKRPAPPSTTTTIAGSTTATVSDGDGADGAGQVDDNNTSTVWNLVDGDELVWRERPTSGNGSGAGNGAESGTMGAPTLGGGPERGITIKKR